MFKISYLLILLFFVSSAQAQSNIIINEKVNSIDVDYLGRVYLIKSSNLDKYDLMGNLLHSYGNAMLGNISSIDVTDPLKILLFFQESNMVVFLNQQLSEVSEPIDLSVISNVEALVSSNSSSGGFWVFDALSMNLKHFNQQRIVKEQSENLAELLNGESPIYLVESNQTLYLQTKTSVLVFDVYGNYLNSWPLSSDSKISVQNNMVQYFNSGKLYLLNNRTLQTEEIKVGYNNEALAARLNKSKLYLRFKDKVVIKTYKQDNK